MIARTQAEGLAAAPVARQTGPGGPMSAYHFHCGFAQSLTADA
jgi:hypothetical protein